MRRRKRIRIRKTTKIRKSIFLLLTTVLILCLGTFASAAQDSREGRIYYESVRIQSGDTLWGIAAQYRQSGEDIESVIDRIMECNGMKTANIRSGENIIVPIRATV